VGVLETGSDLEQRQRDRTPLVIGAMVVLIGAAAALFLFWQSQRESADGPALSDEARAYLDQLDLSGVQMAASDTFLEQTLVEITGSIQNLGNRRVARVEINCVFREVNGVEVAREPRQIVGPKTGPLLPQEQQSFRLAFDNLPPEWNQALPDLYVAAIEFEE
jgi:hypothetical protein